MKKKVLLCFLATMYGSTLFSLSAMASETETESVSEISSEPEPTTDTETESTSELSDDIYSFQIKINSDVYSFPMSFDDLISLGWEYIDDDSAELAPNNYSPTERFKLGDLEAYVTMVNLGINTEPISDCTVAGISIDSFQMADVTDVAIELPGGIQYGVSTLDDITAAYGTPSDTYEGDLYTKVSYEKDYYQDVELYVDSETGFLNEISLENMSAEEDAGSDAAADLSDEPTPEVLAYQAPSELGDDFTSFIVEYAGDLYQLPAPLSEFVKNGWTIDTSQSASYVAGKSYDWVYMSKDNQNYHTIVRNYSPDAAVIENCFVTDVEGNVNSTNLPITVQKGLTLGLTEAEVVSALEGVDYELEDESETFHYYNIKSPESSLDYVQIVINTEDDSVIAINVTNTPKTLD